METSEIMSYAIGVLGTAGGVAGFWRARVQNRVDERSQLQKEQADFRAALSGELGALRTQIGTLSGDKDRLEEKLSEQGKQLVRLEVLDEQKTRQIQTLQAQNKDLSGRVDEQQREIIGLRDERQAAIDQLKAVQSAKDFLERENGELRREIVQLRGAAAGPQAVSPHGES